MGQKESLGQRLITAEGFVELHIEDLVKGRLLWQEKVGKREYPNDVLPSVIHLVGSSLIPVR